MVRLTATFPKRKVANCSRATILKKACRAPTPASPLARESISASGAREDIGKLEIPPELAEKLVPYAGHRGKAADEFLAKNPLTLTTAEAEALDAAVWQDIVGKVEHRYNRETEKNGSGVKFEKLPDEVLSSIVNIAYVSGDNLESKTPKFWSHVTTQDWRAAAAELKDFGFESEGNNERAKDTGERLSVYLDSPGGGRPRR